MRANNLTRDEAKKLSQQLSDNIKQGIKNGLDKEEAYHYLLLKNLMSAPAANFFLEKEATEYTLLRTSEFNFLKKLWPNQASPQEIMSSVEVKIIEKNYESLFPNKPEEYDSNLKDAIETSLRNDFIKSFEDNNNNRSPTQEEITTHLKEINIDNEIVAAKAAELLFHSLDVFNEIKAENFKQQVLALDRTDITSQEFKNQANQLINELLKITDQQQHVSAFEAYHQAIIWLKMAVEAQSTTTYNDRITKEREELNEQYKKDFRENETQGGTNTYTIDINNYQVNENSIAADFKHKEEADAIKKTENYKKLNNLYNQVNFYRKEKKPEPQTLRVHENESAKNSTKNLGIKHIEKIPPKKPRSKKGFWATYGDEIGAMVITWTAAGAGLGATIGAFGGLAVFGIGAIPGAGIGAGLGATIGAVGGLIAGVGVAFVASVSAKKAAKERRADSILEKEGEKPSNKPKKGLGHKEMLKQQFLGQDQDQSQSQSQQSQSQQPKNNADTSFSDSDTSYSDDFDKGIKEFLKQTPEQPFSATNSDTPPQRESKSQEETKAGDTPPTKPRSKSM